MQKNFNYICNEVFSADEVGKALADLDDSIDLEKEAVDVMLSEDIEVIKQLIRDSNENVTEAVSTMATVWEGKTIKILVPTAAMEYAKIVNNIILYGLLTQDEQWRRELAKNILPISIDLCEYARNLIEQ